MEAANPKRWGRRAFLAEKAGTCFLGFLGNGILGLDVGLGGGGRQGAGTQEGGVSQRTRTPQGLASAGPALPSPELAQTQSSVCKSQGPGLPSSGFLESQKSRGVPCTWAGVCVLHEPCFHGKQSLRNSPRTDRVADSRERRLWLPRAGKR